MKVKSITLKNTYHFAALSVSLQTNAHAVSIILGAQASGKTGIIKNIYQALTWYSARLKDLRSAGVVMLDQDVRQECLSSHIDIAIGFSTDIGKMPVSSDLRPEPQILEPDDQSSSHTPDHTQDHMQNHTQYCTWTLNKQINPQGLSVSRVDTTALEQAVRLYQQATQRDPLQGLPMIAYYPSERFINDINLLSKNNPTVFHTQSAYELAAIPFSTFSRFFEWLREVTDIENAHTAHAFQQLIHQATTASSSVDHQSQDPVQIHALLPNQNQILGPHLSALNHALKQILPEFDDLYLSYQPKLQLMVVYQQQHYQYMQLSSSLKNWIALIGDVVRRLCILNPNSLFPCQEGEGVLLIDQIDLGLDPDTLHGLLDRLHHTFPRLQIIATAQNAELLENSTEFQYLSLINKNLQTIQPQQNWQGFEHFYQNSTTHQHDHQDLSQHAGKDSLNNLSKAQALFEQIQQLSSNEQQELNQLLQSGDDRTIPLASY